MRVHRRNVLRALRKIYRHREPAWRAEHPRRQRAEGERSGTGQLQLINALTNAHLWAEIYDRKLTDIFAVESDIAKTIADTLQAKLTGSEKQMIAAQPTSDTAAYELYHKGRSLWDKRSGDNIPKAISFYEQAIARDPNYALAYAGLADAYILLPYYTATAQRDASGKAKEAALKALRLDPNLAEAHAAVGKVLNFAELISLDPFASSSARSS